MKNEKRGAGRWIWVVGICVGLGLFEATQTVVVMRAEGMHHAWTELFFAVWLSWVPWAVAAPVILRLAREHPFGQGSTLGGWMRHVVVWLAIGVGGAAWNASMERWLNPWNPGSAPGVFVDLWRGKFYGQILSSLILYAGILLVGWVAESRARLSRQREEAARMNEQLAKAQLSALRQQIEPHFLFNALNTIVGLVREGRNENAVQMIAGLSELLRRTLKTTDRQQVALGEELEVVKKYLEIEKVRFAERLQVRVEVPEELQRARVPSLILQPIVENAVKHGIAKRVAGGAIGISAARVNGCLTVSVTNDGPGFPADREAKGAGIGLQNVRERLATLYGSAGELQVDTSEKGARVVILVPYVEEGREKK